jgi:hypothetical protein
MHMIIFSCCFSLRSVLEDFFVKVKSNGGVGLGSGGPFGRSHELGRTAGQDRHVRRVTRDKGGAMQLFHVIGRGREKG